MGPRLRPRGLPCVCVVVQASESDLLDVGVGVLQMQERDMTRLFVRRDIFGRFASCMV